MLTQLIVYSKAMFIGGYPRAADELYVDTLPRWWRHVPFTLQWLRHCAVC